MSFDLGMLAKVWHTMEIEVDGLAFEDRLPGQLGVPTGKQVRDFLRGDPRRIFRQEAPLWHGVEAAEQPEPLVGDQRHNVALALDGPQFQRERGAQRVLARDHARAWQL